MLRHVARTRNQGIKHQLSAASPRFGVQTSIAGGLTNAVRLAERLGCDGFQIFSRNPRGWLVRPLDPSQIREFRSARERSGLWPLAIHAVYLINLAAPDPATLVRSRAAFREELKRAIRLGADYLVVHPGNAKESNPESAIATVVESVRVASRRLELDRGAGNGLTILIENTAGQGSAVGSAFEEVAEIVTALNDLPVGVCLDTAHTFAAGYDISSPKGLRATISEIERTIGFDRLKLVHCNDSKSRLGSRVDRHQHIGLGYIGAAAFRRLTRNLKFRGIPFILETPIDKEHGDEWNLSRIRELARSRRPDADEREILPKGDRTEVAAALGRTEDV